MGDKCAAQELCCCRRNRNSCDCRESEAYTHTRVKTSTSEEIYTASPANVVNPEVNSEVRVSPAEQMIRRLSRGTSSGRSEEGSYDQYYD